MRFGSACSGIEAASVAWHPLGWRAAWFSEIEPFPRAVLQHHYPNVPNLGDMTTLPDRIVNREVEAPDVFCGGTPCQAFSVAGLRKSLDDARGNLSLTFCEIANAIDVVRLRAGKPASIVLWENVPGVLSTKDNAFGCFLAGLAGEDDPIKPPRKKWTGAGVVLGPQRAVAWRILDAQYFGVAQRRRRVFVVASARDDFDPAAVLFEFDGLRRDFAPSREAGETTAESSAPSTQWGGIAGSLTARHDSSPCADRGMNVVAQTYDFQSSGSYGEAPVAATLSARDFKSAKDLVAQPIAFPANLSATQHASTEDLAPAMGATNPMAVAFQERGRTDGRSLEVGGDIAYALTAPNGGGRAQERNVLTPSMQVRRLTPIECERLQGFNDNYTAIPWRNKPASECPDGPRYKALGNSWAVPVVRWIGRRIALAVAIAAAANDNKPKNNKAAA